MKRWQWGISSVAILFVVALVASTTTPYGFAMAGDVGATAKRVVEPVEANVTKMEKRLADTESASSQILASLNELRAVAVADTIDRLVRRKCVETDPEELQQLRRDIDKQHVIYQSLAKAQYKEPSCAEVRRN